MHQYNPSGDSFHTGTFAEHDSTRLYQMQISSINAQTAQKRRCAAISTAAMTPNGDRNPLLSVILGKQEAIDHPAGRYRRQIQGHTDAANNRSVHHQKHW
jgi:hypothetical protein